MVILKPENNNLVLGGVTHSPDFSKTMKKIANFKIFFQDNDAFKSIK